MKTFIFLNGEPPEKTWILNELKDISYKICVDGASEYMKSFGIIPDLIVGDLDSMHKDTKEYFQEMGVEFLEFNPKKNKTDTEIAVDIAVEKKFEEIIFYGALGRRIDHTLGNLGMLYYSHKNGLKASIKDEKNQIWICESELNITGEAGDLLSVIPYKNDLIGITLQGLEYPLEDFTMEFGSSRGISNVFLEDEASVKLKSGIALVIKSKE